MPRTEQVIDLIQLGIIPTASPIPLLELRCALRLFRPPLLLLLPPPILRCFLQHDGAARSALVQCRQLLPGDVGRVQILATAARGRSQAQIACGT